MLRCDALILAGGRATAAMTEVAGTPLRSLFSYRGKTFVQSAYEALRGSQHVARVAVIGPSELRDVEALGDADLVLGERDTITANLFAGVDALGGAAPVLITACDNPLLTSAAFDDFLYRVPGDAGIAYPILRHGAFLDTFPHATNTPIVLRDGAWIGGDCALVQPHALDATRDTIARVLAARKSLARMVTLLGVHFAGRFALRRVTVDEVEHRASQIAGVPVRFVRDCDPVFVIDIDDPVDWQYLMRLPVAG